MPHPNSNTDPTYRGIRALITRGGLSHDKQPLILKKYLFLIDLRAPRQFRSVFSRVGIQFDPSYTLPFHSIYYNSKKLNYFSCIFK